MKRLALCLLKDSTVLVDRTSPLNDWELRFALDRQSAFAALTTASFEAVVTDDSWRKGTERDFLADLAVRCPNLMCVRLFNPSEKRAIIGDDSHADQYVPKPCTVGAVVSAIERGQLLRPWLAEPAMRALLYRIRKVPTAPPVYFRLVQILEATDAHLEEIGRIMGEDSAMTAKLLQMVNSSPFGLRRIITDPSEAVAHLGVVQTKALALLVQVFSNYCAENTSRFSLDQWWRHSTTTAKLARAITQSETRDALQADLAFTAGLLHDVGKLFHAVNCPQEYNTLLTQAERNDMLYVDVERHLLGTTHAELGACVFGTWGLSAEILQAVAWHHTPALSLGDSFCPLAAVYVANVLEHELNSRSTSIEAFHLDHDYLDSRSDRERITRRQCLFMRSFTTRHLSELFGKKCGAVMDQKADAAQEAIACVRQISYL
jgi:HD-like signal output (HDOD) protein